MNHQHATPRKTRRPTSRRRARRLLRHVVTAAIGAALMLTILGHGGSERDVALVAGASTTPTGAATSSGRPAEAVQSEALSTTNVLSGFGLVIAVAGILIIGRRRRRDIDNGDLQETRAMLRDLAVEARRLARLEGAAALLELRRLQGHIPYVEHATAQHSGALKERLEDVQARMADVLAHPVEITTAEGFLIAAGSVADVPPQWRVGNIADQVRRQTRAIDQLVRAIDDADAEARNRRT